MLSIFRRAMKDQRGATAVEYTLIASLIAVAAIGTYSLFGKTIRNQTAGMAEEIAGKSADIGKATASAGIARTRADTTKGMSEYNKENDQGGAATP